MDDKATVFSSRNQGISKLIVEQLLHEKMKRFLLVYILLFFMASHILAQADVKTVAPVEVTIKSIGKSKSFNQSFDSRSCGFQTPCDRLSYEYDEYTGLRERLLC